MNQGEDPRMKALAAAIRSASLSEDALASAAALADIEGLAAPDRDAMLAHGAGRLIAYRRMVRNRFRRVIGDWLPETKRRLGERYDAEVGAFTQESAATDAYFRNVPSAFVTWATPRWLSDDSIPDAMVELAEYERLSEDTRFARDPPEPGDPIALDRPIVVDPSVAVRRFAYEVDTWSRQPERERPEPGPRRLLVYRSGRSVKWKVLSELACTLIERLQAGDPLQLAITRACQAAGEPVADEALARIAVLLKEFGDDGILHGAG